MKKFLLILVHRCGDGVFGEALFGKSDYKI